MRPILLSFAATIASHGAAPRSDTRGPPDLHQRQVDVAPGVHLLMQSQAHYWPSVIGNVEIIEQTDGIVLVDSGSNVADGRRVVSAVRALGDRPVKAVILTHWHDDHTLGLAAIVAAWPAVRIIAHPNTLGGMRASLARRWSAAPDTAQDVRVRGELQEYVTQFERESQNPALPASERTDLDIESRAIAASLDDVAGTFAVMPTETFERRLVIPDRVRPVEVRFLGRANTSGDTVVWLPHQRILVTGDIVVAPIPFGVGSTYPADWVRTLHRLASFRFSQLIPGHGSIQHDRTYLDRLVAAIRDVQAQVGRLQAEGVPPDQIRQRVDFSRSALAFAGTDPWRNRWFRQYWPGIADCVYRERNGPPIVEGSSCRPAAPPQ